VQNASHYRCTIGAWALNHHAIHLCKRQKEASEGSWKANTFDTTSRNRRDPHLSNS
jgi:hypothetical protein